LERSGPAGVNDPNSPSEEIPSAMAAIRSEMRMAM
jgi:hypothetical protein